MTIDMQTLGRTICDTHELMDATSDYRLCSRRIYDIDLFVLCVLCNANYLPATALVVIDMRMPFISCNDS